MITTVERQVIELTRLLKPLQPVEGYKQMLDLAGPGKVLVAKYSVTSSEVPAYTYVTGDNWETIKYKPGLQIYAVPRSTD